MPTSIISDDPDIEGATRRTWTFLVAASRARGIFFIILFVVGMTCQVSDVQVLITTVMRRATILHGVVSFFFNTVFIAMAVNAGYGVGELGLDARSDKLLCLSCLRAGIQLGI